MTWQSFVAPMAVGMIGAAWAWWKPHRGRHIEKAGYALGRGLRLLLRAR